MLIDLEVLHIAEKALTFGYSNDWYMALLKIRNGIRREMDELAAEYDSDSAYEQWCDVRAQTRDDGQPSDVKEHEDFAHDHDYADYEVEW